MSYVTVNSKKSGSGQIDLDFEPNSCPFCHHTIVPEKIGGYITPEGAELYYRCSNSECQKHFTEYFTISETQSATTRIQSYTHKSTIIGTFLGKEFDAIIVSISPLFSLIYNQALRAEQLGMDQISGMGFRKAIEFLVKDYLCKKFPEKEREIKEHLLGKCINDYVDNEKIKEISRRAVWIGNDETHYTRKWEDRDISDMKRLIDITNHWIEMEQRTEEYIREMTT